MSADNYTRIRYIDAGHGKIRSTRKFLIGGDSMEVIIDTKNMKYIIKNHTNGMQLTGGRTKNLSILKIQAKEHLEQLGYSFKGEDRKIAHLIEVENNEVENVNTQE